MFLEMVKKRNPELIDYSIQLHQQGKIMPDTYVIDLDRIKENVEKMAMLANQLDIELYFMTKQVGRNPVIAKTIIDAGIEKAVVVDFREAEVMMKNQIPLGNVGHIVQPPTHALKKIMEYGVDYVTIFSIEKMKEVNEIAKELGIKQKIMLRVVGEEDELYPGQDGGFKLEELEEKMIDFKKLKHCHLNALTSFPCLLFDKDNKEYQETNNVDTLKKAKKIMEGHGFTIDELNTPSATSIETLPLIKEIGGTQGEPGHAMTGTTPKHAEFELEEKPAYVYISEVSHNFKNHAYIYGGGYYARGNLEHALIDNKGQKSQTKVLGFPSDNIDYYLELEDSQKVGATVVMAARTQMFVTRSQVALVKGLSQNKPKLVGLYTSQGVEVEGILNG